MRDLVLTLARSHNKSVLSWFTASECQEISPGPTFVTANYKAIAITTAREKANYKAIAFTTATATATAMAKASSSAIVIIIGEANVKVSTTAKTNAESTSIPPDNSHSKVSWKRVKDWSTSHPLKNFNES